MTNILNILNHIYRECLSSHLLNTCFKERFNIIAVIQFTSTLRTLLHCLNLFLSLAYMDASVTIHLLNAYSHTIVVSTSGVQDSPARSSRRCKRYFSIKCFSKGLWIVNGDSWKSCLVLSMIFLSLDRRLWCLYKTNEMAVHKL